MSCMCMDQLMFAISNMPAGFISNSNRVASLEKFPISDTNTLCACGCVAELTFRNSHPVCVQCYDLFVCDKCSLSAEYFVESTCYRHNREEKVIAGDAEQLCFACALTVIEKNRPCGICYV
jgi:hypothetical protein